MTGGKSQAGAPPAPSPVSSNLEQPHVRGPASLPRHPQADTQVIIFIFFFPFNALLLPPFHVPPCLVGSRPAGQPDGIGISAQCRRPISILGGKPEFLGVGEAQLQHEGVVAAQPLLPACPELRKTQNPARTSHFLPNVSITFCSEQGSEGQQGPRAVSQPRMCRGTAAPPCLCLPRCHENISP